MLNYNKNKLINECLTKYYETFSHTLDTADFVPEKYNDKINSFKSKFVRNRRKRKSKRNVARKPSKSG